MVSRSCLLSCSVPTFLSSFFSLVTFLRSSARASRASLPNSTFAFSGSYLGLQHATYRGRIRAVLGEVVCHYLVRTIFEERDVEIIYCGLLEILS